MKYEQIGNRYYLDGNTFPLRAWLKQWGFWFDGDRKQWWTTDEKALDATMQKCNGRSTARPKARPKPATQTSKRRVDDWRKNGLMCGLDSVTVLDNGETIRLDLPKGHCTDMGGAIELALRTSGLCRKVETFAGGRRDTVYKIDDGGDWHAYGYD